MKTSFKVFLVIVVGFVIYFYGRSNDETFTITTHEWLEVKKPIFVEMVRPDLEWIVVVNGDFDNPKYLPDPKMKNLDLGNKIWTLHIALKPGQGVIESAKIRVKRIKEE